MDTEYTKAWEQYQRGLEYQSKISLLPTIDKNERFYAGNQWYGIKVNNLPTPILNVTKRVIDYKVSAVMSDLITMQFSAEGVSDTAIDEQEMVYLQAAKLFTDYTKTLWENLKMDSMNEAGLLDAAISGDMVSYWYWNDKVDAGNGQMGDIDGELIDSCNYFPGDPNNPEINNAYEPVQPYIILAFRRQVEDVRREAKKYGATREQLEMIAADDEAKKQAGDRAKNELEGDDGKCIVLLKLWKELVDIKEMVTDPETGQPIIDPETGNPQERVVGQEWKIFAEKSTKSVVVRKKWDTGLHRYPVAKMNWYKRKGSAYGEAEATSLVPNNIMINKQAAMIALWIRLHGFPKVLYDNTRIDTWTNDIATAIPVNGTDGGGVAGAAHYMQPGEISNAVMQFLVWFIQTTKDMAGANDAALGEERATNTSALIVLQKAAAVPLSSIKRRFYQYVEDIGLIWLDFFTSKYTSYPTRNITITQDGVKQVIQLDTSVLKQMKMKLKTDIGPSTQWNEAAAVQSLDNLLRAQLITFVEYLKRLPNGLIPDKQGLIDDRESAERAQQAEEKQLTYELMARFVDTLPPEFTTQLNQLRQNDPQAYEQQVKQLIKEGVNYDMSGVRPAFENSQ